MISIIFVVMTDVFRGPASERVSWLALQSPILPIFPFFPILFTALFQLEDEPGGTFFEAVRGLEEVAVEDSFFFEVAEDETQGEDAGAESSFQIQNEAVAQQVARTTTKEDLHLSRRGDQLYPKRCGKWVQKSRQLYTASLDRSKFKFSYPSSIV